MTQQDISEVDLTNCDREPIHQLGHVQDFGALVAVTSDWMVAHKSANCDEILELREPLGIGDALAEHFNPEAMKRLRECVNLADRHGLVERVFGIRLDFSEREYDCAVHRSGSMTVIEVEQHEASGTIDPTGLLRPTMAKLNRIDKVEDLCVEAAMAMKEILGFDRVMVYRFHPDESGEVIAEVREEHLESFLHLRYPKTDIPQQARQLYLRNLFRIISDVNAEPVPIKPMLNFEGEPLDLSLSTLRAVSPIHIEYLHNMGVGASLSISIVINGKLWGLFACHHYSRRVLTYSRRTLAELFSQLFSLRLEMVLANAGHALKERGKVLHDRLMARMASGDSLSGNLPVIDEVIEQIIPHDGASAYVEGEYTTRGVAPTREQFLAIVPMLNTSPTSKIVHSDCLKDLVPAAEDFADTAAGALIIPVSRRPRDYIVLWRRDLPHVVTWAGNPEKPVQTGPHGDRLTPRESFAAWKQSVSGCSAPWKEEELAIAESIRVTLLEVILRITDEAMRERAKAQERQELLIAELNHRVRNILTLIRSLISQSRGEADDIEGFADIIGGRIQALAMAHDAITKQNWEPSSLHALFETEAQAYLAGKTDRVNIDGVDALVKPEAYTVLALVIHEMMTNSAKYGSLCDSRGSLDIVTDVDRFGDLRISWRERGGPPVKAPERRGFGSTIIERSIPFELGGTAEIRYELRGVEADFLIPARFVAGRTRRADPDDKNTNGSARAGERSMSLGKDADSRPVLLVEDNMIIAMDAEDMLKRLGYARIVTASSADQALRAIAEETPQFALLDFNLGDESSEPVAIELEKAQVPYWFVTGYGEALEEMTDRNAYGILQKPYTEGAIGEAIASLAG